MQAEADAFQAQPFHLVGPQVGFAVQAIEENPRPGEFGHFCNQESSRLRMATPSGGRARTSSDLPWKMASCEPARLGVDRADIGHHAHMRQGDLAQEGDFAGDIKTHFQHGPFVTCSKPAGW